MSLEICEASLCRRPSDLQVIDRYRWRPSPLQEATDAG